MHFFNDLNDIIIYTRNKRIFLKAITNKIDNSQQLYTYSNKTNVYT